MKKNKYDRLFTFKKLKKNKLEINLSTLNSEKKKIEDINNNLKKIMQSSDFSEGELISSSSLKQASNFRINLQEKIDISSNRKQHLKNEIKSYLLEINKIKKQQEKILKKRNTELLIKEQNNESKQQEDFRNKTKQN
ncbi:MAG: hypothetical protein CMN01_05660 [Rickettsiales bacterium]|nr:hypothetical protein [Rickettsiales bacterium]|tara:strand:- start:954 stop:1364 length:411 start_codon:yes stop_codon:yes gene_type:complete